MKNYYETLGVSKTSTKDEIKKAFHKLAHKYHPDKEGGDEAKFKEVNEAYSVLSDDKKRSQFDTFGSNGNFQGGNGGAGFGGFDFSGFQQGFGGFNQGGDVEFDLGDILGQFFGGGRPRQKRGKNIQMDVELTFKESIFGTNRELKPKDKKITVSIPPGIDNGTTLRVQGYGEELQDAQPGDLLVRIWVIPDNNFKKEGSHLVTDLHIKLTSAILGDEIPLETLDGLIDIKIPEGVHHAELLRIKGKGVPSERSKVRGDLYVRILIDMPKKLSKDQRKKIEELKKEGI